jgi:pyruvate,orthophosphate dikinase
LKIQKEIVRRVVDEVSSEKSSWIEFLVGTTIEIPRAVLIADKMAQVAKFFSFNTNGPYTDDPRIFVR